MNIFTLFFTVSQYTSYLRNFSWNAMKFRFRWTRWLLRRDDDEHPCVHLNRLDGSETENWLCRHSRMERHRLRFKRKRVRVLECVYINNRIVLLCIYWVRKRMDPFICTARDGFCAHLLYIEICYLYIKPCR